MDFLGRPRPGALLGSGTFVPHGAYATFWLELKVQQVAIKLKYNRAIKAMLKYNRYCNSYVEIQHIAITG